MTEAAISERLDKLTDAVLLSLRMQGQRLSRSDMCVRLGVTPKTLSKRIITGHVPQPGSDGKWLLAEVVEMECRR